MVDPDPPAPLRGAGSLVSCSWFVKDSGGHPRKPGKGDLSV
jgi:hypothetical protein